MGTHLFVTALRASCAINPPKNAANGGKMGP